MNVGFFACNVGSMFLGMTMAFAVLLTLAGRNGQADGTDGCLTTLLCICGFGVALFFYVLAITGPA